MVLLPDVIPSFIIKLVAPFFIHIVPYKYRISLLVALSFVGMVVVAGSDSVPIKLFGIAIASLSSGLGEISFLSLTHFYGMVSISGFSSGTGGAGLVGSFVYLVLTTWIQLSVKATLLLFSIVPITFGWPFIIFFLRLIQLEILECCKTIQSLITIWKTKHMHNYWGLSLAKELGSMSPSRWLNPVYKPNPKLTPFQNIGPVKAVGCSIHDTIVLVYVAEYIINQGISPTLLFPIEEMPFRKYRDAYVT